MLEQGLQPFLLSIRGKALANTRANLFHGQVDIAEARSTPFCDRIVNNSDNDQIESVVKLLFVNYINIFSRKNQLKLIDLTRDMLKGVTICYTQLDPAMKSQNP